MLLEENAAAFKIIYAFEGFKAGYKSGTASKSRFALQAVGGWAHLQ